MPARIGAGLVIFHPSQSSILLVRDTRTDLWSFPKGRAESYDRDLVDTAVRETYEETGFVKDVNYRLLSHVSKLYGNTNILWAEATSPTLVFDSCIEQHVAEVAWIPISQIPHLKANSPVRVWAEIEYA
jgi:8-oxo-dGTP pyrophosphatase MutT (NUDIX family)